MNKNISEDIKREILNEYMNTRRTIKKIAKKYNLLYEEVIGILEEYRNIYGDITRNKKEMKPISNLEEDRYQLKEKGKSCVDIAEPKPKRASQISPYKQEINEEIYNLREQGLSYLLIAQQLKKQGKKMSGGTVRTRCKEIYKLKGKKEPKPKRASQISPYKQEINEEIYNLKEQGLTYERIVEELEKQGIQISISTVYKRCKEIYSLRRGKNLDFRKITAESEQLDKEIYDLREQGLSYKKIAEKLTENGTTLTRQRAEQRHKRFLKSNQQLAKAILNLIITRKATMEQIQQIAEYYGVDLEETMNLLDER